MPVHFKGEMLLLRETYCILAKTAAQRACAEYRTQLEAARALGVSKATLHRMLRYHSPIEFEEWHQLRERQQLHELADLRRFIDQHKDEARLTAAR